MAVVDNKVPPVPSAMDVLQPEGKSNKISIPWLQWFLALREKINILNESIVNLADLTGIGILVKNGAQWLLRSITSPLGTIDIANADGSSGNIELDLPESGVTPGVYGDSTHVAIVTVNEFGIVTDIEEVAIAGGGSRSTVTVLTPVAGVVTIDYSLGDYFTLAPTANVTSIVFTNLPASPVAITLSIRFTQDTTARTVAFPAAFDWEGGVSGTVSTGSGAVDLIIITSFNQGTTWQASIGKAFS